MGPEIQASFFHTTIVGWWRRLGAGGGERLTVNVCSVISTDFLNEGKNLTRFERLEEPQAQFLGIK